MDDPYIVTWINIDSTMKNKIEFDNLTQAIKFYNFLLLEFETIRSLFLTWGDSHLLEYHKEVK